MRSVLLGLLLGMLVAFLLWLNTMEVPPVSRVNVSSATEAIHEAKSIAQQECWYVGYKNLGIDDYGAQQFKCGQSFYTLRLGQTHLYDEKFLGYKAGDPVRFRWSEKLLMKPVYFQHGAKQEEMNPAYYLEPLP